MAEEKLKISKAFLKKVIENNKEVWNYLHDDQKKDSELANIYNA